MTPTPTDALAKAKEAFQQIADNADLNMPDNCNKGMALDFISQIAKKAIAGIEGEK